MENYYIELAEDLEGYFIRFEATDSRMVLEYLESKYLFDSTWTIPWKSIMDHQAFSMLRCHRVTINAKCGPLERKTEDASNAG